MKKLTEAQKKVLRKLGGGWEMGAGMTLSGGFWMQNGGLERGGERMTIHSATAYALEDMGLVERCEHAFPVQRMALTKQGKIVAMGLVEK
jgi:hypothetical protein